ncbi:MAG: hypothetical protein KatS3mg103_0097 [Phycisphaerales bacterium]|nr:MAG: hypothetical protein KatS3mg103_0097 [Phycisphaerales bacterium]
MPMQYSMKSIPGTTTAAFRGQWVVTPCKTTPTEPAGTIALTDNLFLHYFDRCRFSLHNTPLGKLVCLGVAASESDFSILHDNHFAKCNSIEDYDLEMARFAGCYTIILTSPSLGTYVWSDPAGMSSTYYSNGRAASTPTLLTPGHEPACHHLDPLAGWIPGTLTHHPGVRFLLGNHRLQLNTGQLRRYWPTGPIESELSSVDPARIADYLVNTTRSVALLARDFICSLSGGYDSRVVAALIASTAAESLHSIFTLTAGRRERDAILSEQVCRTLGLEHLHRYVLLQENTPDLFVQEYARITGGLIERERSKYAYSVADIYQNCYPVHANGNLGAITTRFYKLNRIRTSDVISQLQQGFRRRFTPDVIRDVSIWVDLLPQIPAELASILLYAEHRGGKWMGPGDQASRLVFEPWTPFCSRRLMLDSYRWKTLHPNSNLAHHITTSIFPALARVPYNSGKRSPLSRICPRSLRSQARAVLRLIRR